MFIATSGPRFALLLAFFSAAFAGCTLHKPDEWDFNCSKCAEPLTPGCCPNQLKIDEPCKSACLADECPLPIGPSEIGRNFEPEYFNLTLDQAISITLQNSKVLRDLGGTVLANPNGTSTAYDPAAVYADPRFGEEAALSAFDTSLGVSMFFDNNDRVENSTFIGNGGAFKQDLGIYNIELRKRAATGTQLAFRHVSEYDANNFVGNQFSSSWQTYFDAEVRQPLLQGAGLRFNRIAGPSNQPGVINGVLIARIRSDISLADFEVGVRDLISDVENAYWDLYFAYYDLDAKKLARDESLSLWQKKKAKQEQELIGKSEVEQALEQYWRFESAVIDAYNGSLVDRTSTNNGSFSGTFRNPGGLRVAERRLRLIMGMPINSGQLIKPITNPPDAPMQFDWHACSGEALALRTEIRRQRWRVKQRELELIANKNFLTPQLDLVGRHRWRGFGKSLISQSNATQAPTYSNAWGNLTDGNNQEWQLGVELNVPIGFRQGHAAVRNSELLLVRETALLKEQERTVIYGLSNAFGEVERAFLLLQAQHNRKEAAKNQVETLKKLEDEGKADIDVLLESQRQLVDSRISYYQSRVEYVLALKNLHFEKGTILEYNDVHLAESASPSGAYADAKRRRQNSSKPLNYIARSLNIGKNAAQASLSDNPIKQYVTRRPEDPVENAEESDKSAATAIQPSDVPSTTTVEANALTEELKSLLSLPNKVFRPAADIEFETVIPVPQHVTEPVGAIEQTSIIIKSEAVSTEDQEPVDPPKQVSELTFISG